MSGKQIRKTKQKEKKGNSRENRIDIEYVFADSIERMSVAGSLIDSKQRREIRPSERLEIRDKKHGKT